VTFFEKLDFGKVIDLDSLADEENETLKYRLVRNWWFTL